MDGINIPKYKGKYISWESGKISSPKTILVNIKRTHSSIIQLYLIKMALDIKSEVLWKATKKRFFIRASELLPSIFLVFLNAFLEVFW